MCAFRWGQSAGTWQQFPNSVWAFPFCFSAFAYAFAGVCLWPVRIRAAQPAQCDGCVTPRAPNPTLPAPQARRRRARPRGRGARGAGARGSSPPARTVDTTLQLYSIPRSELIKPPTNSRHSAVILYESVHCVYCSIDLRCTVHVLCTNEHAQQHQAEYRFRTVSDRRTRDCTRGG